MEENKEILEETIRHSLSDVAHPDRDVLESVTQQGKNVTNTRDRKLTEKGETYKRETLERNRNTAYRKMANQMKEIIASLEENMGIQLLTAERDILDSLKEELNQAFKEYHDTMTNEEEKQASYQWFDIRDREYTECRLNLSERLYALERKSERSKSLSSVRSRSSASSKSSRRSVISKRIEAASRAAKLQIEMDFIEQETEFRKLQIKKEIALANAEQVAISEFLKEECEEEKGKTHSAKETTAEPGNTQEPCSIQNPTPCVKKRNLLLDPNAASFKPSVLTKAESPLTCGLNQEETASSPDVKIPKNSDSCFRDLIKLQERQTELSAMIANQQRISLLPVQEPPVFCSKP